MYTLYFTDLTDGELAAIIVVCVIVFIVSLGGFIFFCLFYWLYWLPRKRSLQQARVVDELLSRRPSSIPAISSRQLCQQTVLSNPDPPKYQEALDKEASSLAPPAYED